MLGPPLQVRVVPAAVVGQQPFRSGSPANLIAKEALALVKKTKPYISKAAEYCDGPLLQRRGRCVRSQREMVPSWSHLRQRR